MKHIMFAGLVSCTIFFSLGAAEKLLLPNGDFEEGMFDWDSPTWPKNSLTSSTVEGVSAGNGKRSLLLAPPVGKNTVVFSTAPIKTPPGTKKFVTTLLIKVAPGAVTPEKDGTIEVRQYYKSAGKSGTAVIQIPFRDIKTDWTRFKLESDVPEITQIGSIWIFYSGNKEPVKIYIDDIKVNAIQ